MKSKRYQLGFTLIEMMITVAIISILAGIAYPSYVSYVTQANRSEALEALMRIANLQEQYYLDNKAYTKDLTKLGLSTSPYITDHGYYSLASIAATDYKITATPLGSQLSRDLECPEISISSTGNKTPKDCWK